MELLFTNMLYCIIVYNRFCCLFVFSIPQIFSEKSPGNIKQGLKAPSSMILREQTQMLQIMDFMHGNLYSTQDITV